MRMQQRFREETIAVASRCGMPLHTTRKLLSIGTTLHRLSEAQCNGDWPCDNGQRPVTACMRCEGLWVRDTIKSSGCPECRATARAQALCPEGWRMVTQGDPRGRVLYAVAPDGTEVTFG